MNNDKMLVINSTHGLLVVVNYISLFRPFFLVTFRMFRIFRFSFPIYTFWFSMEFSECLSTIIEFHLEQILKFYLSRIVDDVLVVLKCCL